MPPSALIVDDEPGTNAALAALLGMFGYNPISAFNGVDAQRRVIYAMPDVVLLDLMLPDLHGLEICRAWKAEPATALVPVIIVSARLAAQNRAECFRAGACEFVAKPFTIDQIQNALHSAAAWSASVRQDLVTGTLHLHADDEAYQRERNRLRSTLVARSPRASQILQEIDALRSTPPSAPVATASSALAFRIDSQTLSVSLPQDAPAPDSPLFRQVAPSTYETPLP